MWLLQAYLVGSTANCYNQNYSNNVLRIIQNKNKKSHFLRKEMTFIKYIKASLILTT